MKVDTPLGPDFVPDLRVVERAKREDLQQTINYQAGLTSRVGGLSVIICSATTQLEAPPSGCHKRAMGVLKGPSGLLGMIQDT